MSHHLLEKVSKYHLIKQGKAATLCLVTAFQKSNLNFLFGDH